MTLSRSDRIAILGALAIFLSVVEYMIPKPVPFMRIGIANIPILISLVIFTDREVWLLTLVKIAGQGLVNGTLFSYIILFSATGTLSSVAMMLLLRKLCGRNMSLVGISVAGAFTGNLLQTLLAMQIIFGRAALLMAPPFLLSGLVSGAIMGFFADRFTEKSIWVRNMTEADP
jgi:heptaprenyl diphosphate synthase